MGVGRPISKHLCSARYEERKLGEVDLNSCSEECGHLSQGPAHPPSCRSAASRYSLALKTPVVWQKFPLHP